MHQPNCFSFALLFILMVFSCTTPASEPQTPVITAQGFDISTLQEGVLGNFGQIRVRFEVPERIEELYIKERSYAVDLARTPEMSHFQLFGLRAQVRQLTDVTLNFESYINEKLESAGDYAIELTVTDRKGRSASASLRVRASEPVLTDTQIVDETLSTDSFEFVRVGTSTVTGAEEFGITWRTIETGQVLIELSSPDDGVGGIIELTPSEYDQIVTKKQLENMASNRQNTSTVRLAAASNKAAGAVFAVVSGKGVSLFKVTRSYTAMSPRGTTVTLVGEYRN